MAGLLLKVPSRQYNNGSGIINIFILKKSR